MVEWLVILVVAGLVYKLVKLRVIHLEFGESDNEKPVITHNKRRQLKK